MLVLCARMVFVIYNFLHCDRITNLMQMSCDWADFMSINSLLWNPNTSRQRRIQFTSRWFWTHTWPYHCHVSVCLWVCLLFVCTVGSACVLVLFAFNSVCLHMICTYIVQVLQIRLTNRMNRIFLFFIYFRMLLMRLCYCCCCCCCSYIYSQLIYIRILYMFCRFYFSAISLSTIYIFAFAMGI